MFRTLAFVALVSTSAHAQPVPRVASLDWMTGTWTHEDADSRVTESWVGPANGLMVAANLSAWKGGRKFHEFLRIADTPEGFSYYASPGGKPATEFKLKEQAERRVVFENPAHDFPQRIAYWREGERLCAEVSGTAKGKSSTERWCWDRAVL